MAVRRRPAPGWAPPAGHLARVKATLRASWPASLLHYRSGGIAPDGKPWPPLGTPILYLCGAEDGCVPPAMAAGQERGFAPGAFQSVTLARVGHFPHLEQREEVTRQIPGWLSKAGT